MAIIPTHTARAQLPGPENSPHPDIVDFKSEALGRLGQAVQQFGAAAGAALDKQKAAKNDLWFAKAKADTSLFWQNRTMEMQGEANADDAPGAFSEKVLGEYDTYLQDTLKGAPSDKDAERFQIWAINDRAGIGQNAIQFDVTNGNKNSLDKFNQVMDSRVKLVFNADPNGTAVVDGEQVNALDAAYDLAAKEAKNDLESARPWMTPDQEREMSQSIIHSLQLARMKKISSFAPLKFLDEVGAAPANNDYFGRLRRESGGNPNAKNKLSSASGLYQFTEGTWETVRRQNPGLKLAPFSSGRFDVAQQERAIRALTSQNQGILQSAGIPINDANLYAAHFLGAGGAVQVLKASDGDALAPIVGAAVMKANPHLNGMSVGQFKAWSARFIGGKAYSVDPALYGALSIEEIEKGANAARGLAQGALADRAANSLAITQFTGNDDAAPSLEDFVAAHGEGEGQSKFNEYDKGRQYAQDLHGLSGMTPGDQSELLDSYKPDPSQRATFADDLERYGELQSAMVADAEARTKEPFAYSLASNETLANAWAGANTAKGFSDAIAATQRHQTAIGIPADNQVLLPRSVVNSTLKAFMDPEIEPDRRLRSLADTMFASDDPQSQEAILRQMEKAGVEKTMRLSLDVFQQGRPDAAYRLARAALITPEDLGIDLKAINDTLTPDTISAQIQTDIMNDGQIGFAVWSPDLVGYGEPADQLSANMTVLQNAVRLSLIANRGNLNLSISRAVADVFGDLVPYKEPNARLALPPHVDGGVAVAGLKTWNDDIRQGYAKMYGIVRPAGVDAGARWDRETEGQIEHILENGLWRNYRDGFAFYDTLSGTLARDANGEILIVRPQMLSPVTGRPTVVTPGTFREPARTPQAVDELGNAIGLTPDAPQSVDDLLNQMGMEPRDKSTVPFTLEPIGGVEGQ